MFAFKNRIVSVLENNAFEVMGPNLHLFVGDILRVPRIGGNVGSLSDELRIAMWSSINSESHLVYPNTQSSLHRVFPVARSLPIGQTMAHSSKTFGFI